MPVYVGRFSGSTTYAIMMYPPVPMPAVPTPAIARPTMSASEFGATPQMRLPSSKTTMAVKKVHFRSKYLYALPQEAWKLPDVRKKAEPYQAALSRPWNSSVILGIAVATMVLGVGPSY